MNSKMKMMVSIKTWIVIYPSITAFYYLFGEDLSMLPLYARTFLLTIILVPWIMFVGIPLLDALLRQFSPGQTKSK